MYKSLSAHPQRSLFSWGLFRSGFSTSVQAGVEEEKWAWRSDGSSVAGPGGEGFLTWSDPHHLCNVAERVLWEIRTQVDARPLQTDDFGFGFLVWLTGCFSGIWVRDQRSRDRHGSVDQSWSRICSEFSHLPTSLLFSLACWTLPCGYYDYSSNVLLFTLAMLQRTREVQTTSSYLSGVRLCFISSFVLK